MLSARKGHPAILISLFLITDYISIIIAEHFAYVIRNILITNSGTLVIPFVNFWIIFPLVFILFLNFGKVYNCRTQFWKVMEKIFYASIYSIGAIIIFMYFIDISKTTSRLFMVFFWLFSFFFLVFFRYIDKKIVEHFELLQIPIVVIGAGKTADLLIKGIKNDLGLSYKILGLIEDKSVKSEFLKQFPVLGTFNDIEKIIKETKVTHVFIATPGISQEKQISLISRVQPIVKNLGIVPNLVGVPMGGIEIDSLFNQKLMLIRLKNNLARKYNKLLKLCLDYIFTIIGTIVISPILLTIVILIYLDSPGPIFFKHKRVGKNGKEFYCYKFRSMCVDAQQKLDHLLATDPEAKKEWETFYKLKQDPRITKIGSFLRSTSLDELPQLINVLKGEMSLVGPRPITKDELVKYGNNVSDYLIVKPGMTGMWQVKGRNDITYNERVQIDSWYVRNWSPWLDLSLLWQTFFVIIRKKGAY
ncbi:MAG: undecaprenyl-phosphate galactose phosphotransferase WbaP [Succinivibrionaceae bacterium]